MEPNAGENVRHFSNASVLKEEHKDEYSEGETKETSSGRLVLVKELKEDVKEKMELCAGDSSVPKEELKEEYNEGKTIFGTHQKWEASVIGFVPLEEPKEEVKEETELSAREDLKPFSNASVAKEELKEEYSEGEQRQQKQKAFSGVLQKTLYIILH